MNLASRRMQPGVYRFTVSEVSAGMRLDQFLAECHTEISRTLARKLIEIGGVHLDGRRMRRCALEVNAGQDLELFVDGLSLEPYTLQEEHILYRDRDLIVVNKPAGVATQPTPARYRGTLYDAVIRYLDPNPGRHRKPSLGMVQRLDRETSGVLVFSIAQRAHKEMTRIFTSHEVDKIYLALVSGTLANKSGTISSQLARRRATNRTVSVKKGGRYAETCYRVLQQLEDVALVEVRLLTGRTHQIRAHFAEFGHPLIGDTDYGGPAKQGDVTVGRQMLHAARIAFAHPVNKTPLSFKAEWPADFREMVQHLGGVTD